MCGPSPSLPTSASAESPNMRLWPPLNQSSPCLTTLPARVAGFPGLSGATNFVRSTARRREARVLTSPFIVRWATWLIALLIVVLADLPFETKRFEPSLLIGTFLQFMLLTTYVPVIAVRPPVVALVHLHLSNTTCSSSALSTWRCPWPPLSDRRMVKPVLPLRAHRAAYSGVLLEFSRRHRPQPRLYVLLPLRSGDYGRTSRRLVDGPNLNSFIGAIISPLLWPLSRTILATS